MTIASGEVNTILFITKQAVKVSAFHGCGPRNVVSINAKEIYHFAVNVFQGIFSKAWVQRHFVIRDFCFNTFKGKYPAKVISLTFQRNMHIFRDEILVKKKFYDEL